MSELLHEAGRLRRAADRLARRGRRMKWALAAGVAIMGVWALLMLMSLP